MPKPTASKSQASKSQAYKSQAHKASAYPSLDGLFDLACRDGVDIRPTLLRVLTDLYVQKPVHTAEEATQYAELAGRLIEAVDEQTRVAVAARLARYPAAPAAILRALAAAGTPPAAQESEARPATAPAKVERKTEAKTETKPETKPDARQPGLADLFFAAAPEERRLILTNLDVVAPQMRALPFAAEAARRLETAALERNPQEVARVLARALDISPQFAERVARDRSGEPIVVAAKALGMQAPVLQRILLFLDPAVGQSVARVHDLARLFDEITPGAAMRMLAIWRRAGAAAAAQPALEPATKPAPAHAPAYYDDERRSARAAATPSEHRVARGRPLPTPRSRSNGR